MEVYLNSDPETVSKCVVYPETVSKCFTVIYHGEIYFLLPIEKQNQYIILHRRKPLKVQSFLLK